MKQIIQREYELYSSDIEDAIRHYIYEKFPEERGLRLKIEFSWTEEDGDKIGACVSVVTPPRTKGN